MSRLKLPLSVVLVCLFALISFTHADEKKSNEKAELASLEQHYPIKDIDGMIERLTTNDKRRVMINPYKMRFEGELMSAPKAGDYSIIYEGLEVWGVNPLPNVTHSSYIKTPKDNVIGVYLENAAAKRLSAEPVGTKATFYALHAYNYEHGPRLLVLSYKLQNELAKP